VSLPTIKQARGAVRLTRDTSRFGYNFLAAGTFRTDDPTKRITALEFFTQAQTHYDGVLHLITYEHALSRTACLQMRALFECWINMCLINSIEGDEWAVYLRSVSERQRIKYAVAIESDNLDEVRKNAQALIKQYGKPIDFTKISIFQPKPRPASANSKKPRDFYNEHPLSFKEKCLLLNYYDNEISTEKTDFEATYNAVYKSLSPIAHLEPYANASVFKREDDRAHVVVSGDPEEAMLVMKFSFMFFMNSLGVLAHTYDMNVEADTLRLKRRFDVIFNH
jgi:hypothetical protein